MPGSQRSVKLGLPMQWRGSNPNLPQAPAASLAEELERITTRVAELVPAASLEPPRRAVRELLASGDAGRALKAGDEAPNFELPDGEGRTFILGDRLAQGPVIVVFYRGRWCPYCVAQLEALERIRPEVESLGATLCAISPQKLQHTGYTAEQHKLRFPVLSDQGNAVARRYGIAWKLPDYLVEHYRRILVNLEHANATRDWQLPIPATFLVAPDGRVAWSRADADFTRRPEPAEVLWHLHQLRDRLGA